MVVWLESCIAILLNEWVTGKTRILLTPAPLDKGSSPLCGVRGQSPSSILPLQGGGGIFFNASHFYHRAIALTKMCHPSLHISHFSLSPLPATFYILPTTYYQTQNILFCAAAPAASSIARFASASAIVFCSRGTCINVTSPKSSIIFQISRKSGWSFAFSILYS